MHGENYTSYHFLIEGVCLGLESLVSRGSSSHQYASLGVTDLHLVIVEETQMVANPQKKVLSERGMSPPPPTLKFQP